MTERRSLDLEGYSTDVTHLREKVRKLEHAIVTFKAHQLGTNQQEYDLERSFKRGMKTSACCEEKQLPSSPSSLPTRVSATFELLGEDVRKLQNELTHMAKKISST